MAVHHGGKVGKAAKTLASSSSSNKAKSQAGKTLANHKAMRYQVKKYKEGSCTDLVHQLSLYLGNPWTNQICIHDLWLWIYRVR